MIKEIILQPYVTEKTMERTAIKKYTFIVSENANKFEIAKKINKIYKVNVKKIQILKRKGKIVFYKRAYKGRKKDIKLAIVTLDKKDNIKDFSIKE